MAMPLDIPWDYSFWADQPGFTPPADGQLLPSAPQDLGSEDYGGSEIGVWGRATTNEVWRTDPFGAGKPAIELIGSHGLSKTNLQGVPTERTAVVIGRALGADSDLFDSGPGNRTLVDTSAGFFRLYGGAVFNAVAADTDLHLFIAHFDGVTASGGDSLTLDGVEYTGEAGSHVLGDDLLIGYTPNGAGNVDGVQVAFVGLIDRALTTQEKADLLVWYQAEYLGVGGGGGILLSDASALYVGSTAAARAYLGSTLVWGDAGGGGDVSFGRWRILDLTESVPAHLGPNGAGVLHIKPVDRDGTDWSTELDAITVGDSITIFADGGNASLEISVTSVWAPDPQDRRRFVPDPTEVQALLDFCLLWDTTDGSLAINYLSPLAQAILATSPFHYWPADESSGDLIDLGSALNDLAVVSGTGTNLYQQPIGDYDGVETIYGSVSRDTGWAQAVAESDTVTRYAQCTIMALIEYTGLTPPTYNAPRIVGPGSSINTNWPLGIWEMQTSGHLYWVHRPQGMGKQFQRVVDNWDGSPVLVAVTVDDTTRLTYGYANGVEWGSNNYSGTGSWQRDANQAWEAVMSRIADESNDWRVAHMAVWDRLLSPTEIADIASAV